MGDFLSSRTAIGHFSVIMTLKKGGGLNQEAGLLIDLQNNKKLDIRMNKPN